MSKQAQATRNTITLKGSTKVVSEFFAYAVNRYVIAQIISASLHVFTLLLSMLPHACTSGLKAVYRTRCLQQLSILQPHDEIEQLTWPRSILYQRGVYPPEDFQPQKQYGLAMMVSTEPGIKKYLCSVLEQMSGGSTSLAEPSRCSTLTLQEIIQIAECCVSSMDIAAPLCSSTGLSR